MALNHHVKTRPALLISREIFYSAGARDNKRRCAHAHNSGIVHVHTKGIQ